jgi:hypothetical protein
VDVNLLLLSCVIHRFPLADSRLHASRQKNIKSYFSQITLET